MNTQHPGPQFTDEELAAIEAEDDTNQARICTHRIAADGVFEPVSNADTGRFLRRLEDWSNDEAAEERPPDREAAAAELDRIAGLPDRHWMNRIMSMGPHELGALDIGELRILALQSRNFEDRLRERGNLFSAEANRRQRQELTHALPDVPAYLKTASGTQAPTVCAVE